MSLPVYNDWQRFAKEIVDKNITSWKRHPHVKYMLEHESVLAATMYIEYLTQFLSKETIQTLATLNDRIGDSEPITIHDIYTSPSSIRYIRHSYDLVKHIQSKNLDNVTIVEIGGGYGGMALIAHEMAKLLGLTIKNYIIYDLPGPGALQKWYLTQHGLDTNVQWNDCSTFCADLPKENETYVLFSSYAVSELSSEYRDAYLRNILPVIEGALLIWNGTESSKALLPSSRVEVPEVPNTNTWGQNTIIRL
jgi:hypothetical protein